MPDKLTPEQYAKLWKRLRQMRNNRNVVSQFGDAERQPGLRITVCHCRRKGIEVFVMNHPVQVSVVDKHHSFEGGYVCLSCDFANAGSHPIKGK